MTPDNHDSTLGLDVPGILAQLTLEEKASLLDGEDFWRTSPSTGSACPPCCCPTARTVCARSRRAVTTSA